MPARSAYSVTRRFLVCDPPIYLRRRAPQLQRDKTSFARGHACIVQYLGNRLARIHIASVSIGLHPVAMVRARLRSVSRRNDADDTLVLRCGAGLVTEIVTDCAKVHAWDDFVSAVLAILL